MATCNTTCRMINPKAMGSDSEPTPGGMSSLRSSATTERRARPARSRNTQTTMVNAAVTRRTASRPRGDNIRVKLSMLNSRSPWVARAAPVQPMKNTV